MNWHIRAFDENTVEDFNRLSALRHMNRPDYDVSGERLFEFAKRREPHIIHRAWIVETETGGDTIGVAIFSQYADVYHPRKFYGQVLVHPDYRRQGLGMWLWAYLEAHLQEHDPLEIKISFFESDPGIAEFAEKIGFVELARRFKSVLDLATFEASKFGDVVAQLAEQGIVIRSIADLADDPERDRKLYDLSWEIDSDVPFYDEIIRQSFEKWKAEYIDDEEVLLDSSFIAVHGDQYVGMSHMMKGTSPDSWLVSLTGTARAYRRRGISRTLKIYAARHAQTQRVKQFETYNDDGNAGILKINASLGYVRQPAIIVMVKRYG